MSSGFLQSRGPAKPASRSLAQLRRLPLSQWDDVDLVEQCLRGNEHAWYAVVEKYKNLVYSAPRKYGMNPQDAADILQEVWVDLHSELGSLRSGRLAGWLISVASHKCYHWKRRRSRNEQQQAWFVREPASREPLVREWMERVQQAQVLRNTIAELPERDQRLIQLLFYQDPPVPYAEVARQLGLAEGSIGFMRANCLRKLRAALKQSGFDIKSPACVNCRSVFCVRSKCEKRRENEAAVTERRRAHV
jgi:RNA polymerase sigma factor (sigma-70 family)